MTYATIADARAAGATGTDAQVTAALATADARVDRFTQQTWAEQTMQVAAPVSGSGVALLPRQIDPTMPVTVRYQGATTDLPTTAYQVTSSRTLGSVDAVYLGAGGADYLIAGAEPYNGGWSNLLPKSGTLLVTGTFGSETTPGEVVAASALIAAAITNGQGIALTAGQLSSSPSVDDEGNTVAITNTADDTQHEQPTAAVRTTGVPAADELLLPLRNRKVRLS